MSGTMLNVSSKIIKKSDKASPLCPLHFRSKYSLCAVTDVGFPYVCCVYVLLPLVNKEADLGLLEHRIEQGRNSKQI